MDSKANVLLRKNNKLIPINIIKEDNLDYKDFLVENWQRILNVVAEVFNVPAALIMKLNEQNIEVFFKSDSIGNPYEQSEKTDLGIGLYCETVLGTDSILEVKNSLEDDVWRDNPDIALNMISYLGLPIKWPNGSFFGTICILDSKEREYSKVYKSLLLEFKSSLEKDLKLLNKTYELENIIDNLNKTRDLVISLEKNKISTELISGIAHEINTPIGIAKTSLSLLEMLINELKSKNVINYANKQLYKQLWEGLDLLKVNIDRAGKLISSYKQVVLDQSRGTIEDFDLNEYLNGIFQSLVHELKLHNVTYHIKSKTIYMVRSYPGLFSQVLINLIMNSIKHGFVNSKTENIINIEITDAERGYKLIYQDNGQGIPSELKEEIFKPFFTTSKGLKSSGLGLGIAKNIVENKLHGTLKYDYNGNKKTAFKIFIPKDITEYE